MNNGLLFMNNDQVTAVCKICTEGQVPSLYNFFLPTQSIYFFKRFFVNVMSKIQEHDNGEPLADLYS